jgi:hypothetical protein
MLDIRQIEFSDDVISTVAIVTVQIDNPHCLCSSMPRFNRCDYQEVESTESTCL